MRTWIVDLAILNENNTWYAIPVEIPYQDIYEEESLCEEETLRIAVAKGEQTSDIGLAIVLGYTEPEENEDE